MTYQELKKKRIINMITFIIMMGINIYLYFTPTEKSMIKTLNGGIPKISINENLILIYMLVILSQIFFFKYQMGIKNLENMSARAASTLGWTFPAINILNVLTLLSFYFSIPVLTLILSFAMFIVLLISNDNIKDDRKIMEEKLYVRNPFSFYLGWVIFTITLLVAYIFRDSFNKEIPMIILFAVMALISIGIAVRNHNIGMLLILFLSNIAIYPISSEYSSTKILWFVVALILISYYIYRSHLKEESKHWKQK